MELSKRIVIKFPLDSLWTEKEELDAKRIKYLDQNEISEVLKKGPIQFVIANLGDKLIWKQPEECYKVYKKDFKNNIIANADDIDISNFKDGFGYLASMWDNKSGTIILLEVFH